MTSFSDSSSWYISTAQSGPLLLMQHPHPTLTFKSLILFLPTLYLLPLHPHHGLMLLAPSLYVLLLLFLPDSLRVLQWNAGGHRVRSTELLHFILSHPVDLFCIQESNLNLSSSLRIPGFSALRSDHSHSQSGIFSTDATDTSSSINIFVRQSLSFSELSIFFLSSLDPYSDCVKVNIYLNDSSLLSFLNVYAPPICSSPKNSRTNFFFNSIFLSSTNLLILEDFHGHHPLYDSKCTSDPCGEKAFDWIISSDLLLFNEPDIPTLLYCSSGSCSSPDISFALFSLSLSCSWEVL